MKAFVKAVINLFLCKIFYRVKYYNKEVEENIDKCVICANHSNPIEPTFIYAKTKNLCIMAKSELFSNKLLGNIFKYFDVFPIRRGEHDARSLIHAIKLFENVDNRKLLIFPEGTTIKKDRERGDAKVGPAYVAYKAKIPIVPVYITKNSKLFHRVDIIYGEPMYVTEEIGKDKIKLQEFSDKLLSNIYELKSKEEIK